MTTATHGRRPGDTLGYLVIDIVRMMSLRFDQRARAVGVTRAQWSLIAALVRSEGATQAQLAEWMQVAPISVGRLVDRMERAGWLERRAEPGDRRAYRIYLTDKAHAIRPELRRLSAQTEKEALAGLDEPTQLRLLASLETVRAGLAALPPVNRGG
jgi:DNA-binding MarR family transcriptional regulator